MAGTFSGHLINSFHAQQVRPMTPFGSDSIIRSGAMSFNPQMHGTPAVGNQSMGDYSFAFGSTQPSLFNPELSEATTLKIAALQTKLNQKLGPEYISQRPGPGGGPKLTYAEGWKIINLANEVFGFNGWSSNVVSLTTDFIDYNEESKRYSVGATAIIRVTLRDGVFHEDIGYGLLENSKSKGAAIDKCKKEAVTDGLKRALRNFGNLLGNCLYDKAYTQEVVKIKVPQPKFDKSKLHRRPEFEEMKPNIVSTSSDSMSSSRISNISMNLTNNSEDVKPNIATTSTSATSRLAHISTNLPNNTTPSQSPDGPPQQPTKVMSSIPSHIRSEINAVAGPSHSRSPASAQATSSSSAQRSSSNQSLSTTVPGHSTFSRNDNPCQASEPARHVTVVQAAENVNASNASRPEPHLHSGSEDADESYHFGSDDDAFLALVDLGEGDMEQPLLPETDLGRPLFEDGSDVNLSGIFEDEEAQAQSSLPRKQAPEATSSAGMLSRLLPHNQQQQQQHPQRPSNPFGSGSKPSPQQPRPAKNQSTNRQQERRSFHIQAALKSANETQANRIPRQRSHQNQNRPPTPSMGSFHFPPGVDPRVLSGQKSGSGIGTKRPLESMTSSTTARPALAGGPGQGQGQVKREVLGKLDVGEGGDVKRVRR